jgi:hypothetical protein
METRRKGYRWRPIADLPPDWRRLENGELASLIDVWELQKSRLAGTKAFHDFQARLVRRWSIETGILERLYALGQGITITLVEQGFDASLLSHGDSDLPPAQLIQILEDHRQVAEGLFAFVKQNRPLSTSYIKELHAALTRHQEDCEAIDSLGRALRTPLLRGEYKRMPDNVGDPTTGEIWHEYCPPEHVAAEMEQLVRFHLGHDSVPYEVEAAWLHHRFTQIHPFQDGNGRVARALATLICLRAGAFPLVVMRDHKTAYLRALEVADDGDLKPLVELFRRLQKEAFLSALKLSQDALDREAGLDAIVSDAKHRLESALVRRVEGVQDQATRLAGAAHQRLQEVARRLNEELASTKVRAAVSRSTPNTSGWFRAQIIRTAKHLGYFANLTAPAHWVRLQIRHEVVTDFVVSIHHLGSAEDAIMVATSFLEQRGSGDDGDPEQRMPFTSKPTCDEAFTLTAGRDPAELDRAFAEWLERALQIGLDAWRRTL